MQQNLIAALVGVVSVAACGPAKAQPPEAYISPVDQQIAKSGQGVPGRPYPCALERTERGLAIIESVPTDQCVRMEPPKEWRGLWRNDFEGSQFCATPASTCDFDSEADRVWLTSGPMHGKRGGLYEVRFVGRRTMFRGIYGHMGMSDYEIIVDRPISVRMVQAPPPPLSKAEADAAWKRCEKAGNCISTKKLLQMEKDSK